MKYEPHTLHKVIPGQSYKDDNGDSHTSESTVELLGGCFQYNVTTEMKQGYQGLGIDPKYYVNLDRRDDLSLGDMVEVRQDGKTIGKGQILDIKRTSGLRFGGLGEYMTIYI